VNRRLGKHVPVSAQAAIAQAHELAATLPPGLPGRLHVVGLGETATALGAEVAFAVRAASFTSTTRYPDSIGPEYIAFRENHSHAPDHTVSTRLLGHATEADTVVIVDDEVTTGNTFANLTEALRHSGVTSTIVCAAVVDSRSQSTWEGTAPRSGLHSEMRLYCVERLNAMSPPRPERMERPGSSERAPEAPVVELPPVAIPAQRRGLSFTDLLRMSEVARSLAESLRGHLEGREVMVIGAEEFMHLPILTAHQLDAAVQSTTRSPIYCSTLDGYPVRSGWRVPSVSDSEATAYIYNLNTERSWVRDAVLMWPVQPAEVDWLDHALEAASIVAQAFDRIYLQPVMET
jgi:hypothetical protein